MAVDESIAGVNPSFGLPIQGRGPKSLLKRATAKFVWPFLRHQVDVNMVLVTEIRELQSRQQALITLVEQQLSDSGHINSSIRRLGAQIDFVEDGLHNVENALHILEGQYTFVVEQRESHLADVQTHLARRTGELENQIDLGQRQLLARFYDGFGALQRDVAEIARNFAQLSSDVERFSASNADEIAQFTAESSDEIAMALDAFARAARAQEKKLTTLRTQMAQVDHFLSEVKRSYPEMVKPEQLVVLPTGFDAIADAFAESFRGSHDEVKERVSAYLPELKSVQALGPVVDIGCGRGEFLEVLKEAGIEAYGIDLSTSVVEHCQSVGLNAIVDDALHHLSSVTPGTLGAVTAIHVVEHLGVDTLIALVDLALQALSPGGLLIFETPNPKNVTVGAETFYMDPTHIRPIPSAFLEFVVSLRGFSDAQIVSFKRTGDRLESALPRRGAWANDMTTMAEHLSELLLGPEDYAVIARRAK